MFVCSGVSGILLFFVVYSTSNFVHGQTNYCGISSCSKGQHSMCLYQSSSPSSQCQRYDKAGLLTSNDKAAIVKVHNDWRAKVANGQESQGKPGPQPPASDMKQLVWDDELAQVAQRYADQCIRGHDKCRNVDRFSVGQNIATFWTSGKPNLDEVDYLMQGWYDEVRLFNKNGVQKYSFESGTGHYTQAVWANTSHVGCGRILFWDSSLKMNCVRLICNYGPAGNYIGQSIYQVGKAGSKCASGVSRASSSLCNA